MAEVTENEATKTLQREATIAFVKALRVLKPLLVMILPAMRLALVFKALRIVWFIEPPYALGLLTFLGLVLTLLFPHPHHYDIAYGQGRTKWRNCRLSIFVKGQLISKCLFGVNVSTKIATKIL